MGFLTLPTKARRDPLGVQTQSGLLNNLRWLRSTWLREHLATGEHNAREVARVVRRVNAALGVSPASTDITGASSSVAGLTSLTLASGRFATSFMAPLINVNDDQVINKPHVANYVVNSATSVDIWTWRLSSALGSAESWALATSQFDIALHSEPLAFAVFSGALPTLAQFATKGLTLVSDYWNQLVQADGDYLAALKAAHTSAGAHSGTREPGSKWAILRWDGTKYNVEESSGGSWTLTLSSTGILSVTYPSAFSTSPSHVFVAPDWTRTVSTDSTPLNIPHAYNSGTTGTTIYMYQRLRTGSSWNRANFDLFLDVHGV